MKKSFTLIELIVVIAIIAVLAAVIAPQALKAIEKAKIAKTIAMIDYYKKSCSMFYTDTGLYATQGSGEVEDQWHQLRYEVPPMSGWDGPYIEQPKPSDSPFNSDFSIHSHNEPGWTCQGPCGFDINRDGIVDINGDGNTLTFFDATESLSQKINNAIDGEEGANWTQQGRVEYDTADSVLSIYLIGE